MKLQGWIIMLTAMVMFLSLLGLPIGFDSILNAIGADIDSDTTQVNSIDIENSSFWSKIFGDNGILVLLGLGAVVTIGLFARGYDPSLIVIPFIIFAGGVYIVAFSSIISYVITFNQSWMTKIISIIFGALMVGYIVACVDYFAGR